MKKTIAAILAVMLMLVPLQTGAAILYDYPQSQNLTAPSAMLVYLGVTPQEDIILFEKNADEAYQTGALLRVAVGAYAMQCIEQQQLDIDAVTGTYTKTLFNHYVTGTGLGTASMALGERWTLRDLLAVCMVQTAADAAVTLAQTLSGSVEAVVEGMNQMILEAGCTNTCFTNVTGEDSAQSRQSARDLYRLMRIAADHAVLREMMSASYVSVTPVSGGQKRGWENTNGMLRATSEFYYDKARYGRSGVGGEEALQSAVTVASDGGYEYLAIVMGEPYRNTGSCFKQLKNLLQWGFNGFAYKTLLNKNEVVGRLPVELSWDTDSVTLVAAHEFSTVVVNEIESSMVQRKVILHRQSVQAPVTKGQVLGKVELYLNVNQKIGEVDLIAGESLERSGWLDLWENKILHIIGSPWLWIGLGTMVLLFVGFVIFNVLHNRRRRKNKMKRINRFHF